MPSKPRNKERASEVAKAYYIRNRASIIANAKVQKVSSKAAWREFITTLKCAACGQNHPATFDFHHVIRDKGNRKIHDLVRNHAFRMAREEIKKCVVLCSNCHRILHYNERQAKNAE